MRVPDFLRETATHDFKLISVTILLWLLWSLSGLAIVGVTLHMVYVAFSDHAPLMGHAILLAILIVGRGILFSCADFAKHYTGFDIVSRLRQEITKKMKLLSLGYYTRERLGDIATIIHHDIDNVELTVAHIGTRLISDILMTLITAGFLFAISPLLFLWMLIPLPLALFVLIRGLGAGEKTMQKTRDDMSDMVSRFVEYARGIPVLKAFSQNRAISDALEESIRRFGVSSRASAKTAAIIIGAYLFFLEMSLAALLAAGAWMILGNQLTLLQYGLFIILSREFYKPFTNAELYWLYYVKGRDSYNRILSITREPAVLSNGKERKPQHHEIAFEDLSFSYEKESFSMENVSFVAKENTLTALVGPSGSGKTTLTSLLLRFWEPDSGRITIGGEDIRDMEYDTLLSSISIVMQDVILFSDTIYENIRTGNRHATREQIQEAAKKAMIHDFIMGLPHGYDTMVGENGVGLSGGQKQRVSIARAILQDAPIVILDEASSSLDPINERKIQKAITNMARDKTVLVIAHQLKTIENADSIIVLEGGALVEQGSHGELSKGSAPSLYRKLWEAQERVNRWHIGCC